MTDSNPTSTKASTDAKAFHGEYPRIVVAPPGPKARAIIDQDAEYSSTSYIKEYPLAMSHGEGPVVEDVDGNRYLDFMAGIAVASTGYSHPVVVEAVREAAGRFFHICGTDFYYQGMASLCQRLATTGLTGSKKRVFLTNSGTEAVDGAIKLVRNSSGRTDLIAFQGAFHGRTYGAMSLTSSKAKQRSTFGPMVPGVHHVPYPDPYRLETGAREVGAFVLDQIQALLSRHLYPKDVAAIFVEPMLGEGGYVIPPTSFIEGLRALCDEHGILLVFDEIQTGVGRTGHMWAADYFGVEPDVLLTAKGLGSGMPIGAIIARESIMRWSSGSHGSTFGGNPVGCAAALATLDVVEGGLLDNVREMGELMMTGLKRLQEKHPCIGNVRGIGLYIGVELVKDRATKVPASDLVHQLGQLAFTKGLLLLSCGESVIRIAPPLVIDADDVKTGLRIMDECITELTA
ncbi:MAG: acetyl ornithine aminotransferase family protein [Planctomycetes bacterium]|nr:acetyl ornithine aminotransferase family protein [Planctomycetota bacterium]